MDDIIENPRKYGSWDEVDTDDLAAALNGDTPARATRGVASVDSTSDDDEVDATFLREARNSANHYGH